MPTALPLDGWAAAVCAQADGVLLAPTGWARALRVVTPAAAGDLRALLSPGSGHGDDGECWPATYSRAPLELLVVSALDDPAAVDRLCAVLTALRALPLPVDVHVLLGPGDRAAICPDALDRLRDWRRAHPEPPVLFTLAYGISDAGVWPAPDVRRAAALFLATLAADEAFAEEVRQGKRTADEPLWGTFAVAMCRLPRPWPEPLWLTGLAVPLDGLAVVDAVSGAGAGALAVPAHWPPLRCAYAHGFPLAAIAGLDRSEVPALAP